MTREELTEIGLSGEQVSSVLDLHHKELSTVKESLKSKESELEHAQGKLKETEDALKAFDGVDANGINK